MEKLKLFWSILQVPLKFELLCTLPKHLIVLCCILNYLIGACESGPEIKPWEVAVFIAQALWRKTVAELQNLVVRIYNALVYISPRAIIAEIMKNQGNVELV